MVFRKELIQTLRLDNNEGETDLYRLKKKKKKKKKKYREIQIGRTCSRLG